MIVGHQKQINFLNKFLKNKEALSHAFLFVGPDKIGKKTAALEFIKSIQCEDGDEIGKVCGKCSACDQIGKVSADFLIIEPDREEGEQKEIGIGRIRNLKDFISGRPVSNKFKIALIDEAQTMTREAQNALLKILEEPKGNKIIFLIGTNIESFPETIVSRVYTVRFNLVSKKELLEFLKEKNAVKKMAGILEIMDSKPGLAIDFINNDKLLEEYLQFIKDFLEFAGDDIIDRFKFIEKINQSKEFDLKKILNVWAVLLRLALFQKIQSCDLIEDDAVRKKLANFIKERSVGNISKSLELAQRILFLGQATNVNPRLALEIFALNL